MTDDPHGLTGYADALGLSLSAADLAVLGELFGSQVVPALSLQTDPLIAETEPAPTFDPRWDE